MEVIKEEVKETEYTVKLTQSELNTIAIMLGKSTDSQIKQGARDYGTSSFVIDGKLLDLYNGFKSLFK